jgi:tRNA-2-methylthio-N6-dimethylallyladenosine synthase
VARRRISIPTDMTVSFPGEREEDSDQTLSLAAEIGFDALLAFKFLPQPNTPAISVADSIPETGMEPRLIDGQREIKRSNYVSHIGQILEADVERYNSRQAQVIGRTLENKTLNFTTRTHQPRSQQLCSKAGHHSLPNSFVGEAIC